MSGAHGGAATAEQPDVHSATDAYARRFAGPAGGYLLDVQTRGLLRLAAPRPGARVLDVGGGHAQTAAPLIEAGCDVTVLASAEPALARVRQTIGERARTAVGDLCDPPFPDQSFDLAIAFRMMSHVDDWRMLVAGLCRVARRAVIVDFPIPGGSNALEPLLFGMKKRLEGNTRRFATMSKREVRAAFAERGFEADAAIGQFVLPMAAHRALNAPTASRALEAALRGAGLAAAMGTPVILRAVRATDHGRAGRRGG